MTISKDIIVLALCFGLLLVQGTNSLSSSSPSDGHEAGRRSLLTTAAGTTATTAVSLLFGTNSMIANAADETESIFAPKFVQEYADFTEGKSGWRYRDVNPGKSSSNGAQVGDRVVFDWSGYTIGYFGRPFQAKGGPQGGAFDKDLDYARTVVGSGQMIKGVEEALEGMKAGQVRQVVVPYAAGLSYPSDDGSHDRVGPKPNTFSGQRALNFVLDNPRVDRTLLFNVKVIRIDPPDGKGGFARGEKV